MITREFFQIFTSSTRGVVTSLATSVPSSFSAILAALLLGSVTFAADLEPASKPAVVAPVAGVPFVALPRLFNVPTGDVMRSLNVYLNGGGAFGAEKERSVLARAGLGLGDVAEVEVSTWSIVSSLRKTNATIPTSAFKMQVLRETASRPAVAWSLRGTTSWQLVENEDLGTSFQTRLMKLYLVGSRNFGSFRGHFGAGLTDIRVRNPVGWSFADTLQPELQRNLLTPFAGFSAQANPRTLVMAEIDGIPEYHFAAGRAADEKSIRTVWSGSMGVRFYFSPYVAVDSGVRYRSDYKGIADANIHAALNFLLPIGDRLRSAPRS